MRYRLGIGLEWKKIRKSSKLSCLINAIKIILNGFIKYKRYKLFFQWLSILSYAQNSGWLWRAVTSKRFKIQTWDWSRLKENSEIFKITSTEKSLNNFFCLFYQPMKRCVFFSRVNATLEAAMSVGWSVGRSHFWHIGSTVIFQEIKDNYR